MTRLYVSITDKNLVPNRLIVDKKMDSEEFKTLSLAIFKHLYDRYAELTKEKDTNEHEVDFINHDEDRFAPYDAFKFAPKTASDLLLFDFEEVPSFTRNVDVKGIPLPLYCRKHPKMRNFWMSENSFTGRRWICHWNFDKNGYSCYLWSDSFKDSLTERTFVKE